MFWQTSTVKLLLGTTQQYLIECCMMAIFGRHCTEDNANIFLLRGLDTRSQILGARCRHCICDAVHQQFALRLLSLEFASSMP